MCIHEYEMGLIKVEVCIPLQWLVTLPNVLESGALELISVLFCFFVCLGREQKGIDLLCF